MEQSGMNETPERNGDAVNELTAGTWQYINTCFIFFCTIERVVGVCGSFRVGAVAKSTASLLIKSAMVLDT